MKYGMEVNIRLSGSSRRSRLGVGAQAMSAPIKLPSTNEMTVAIASNPMVQGTA